MVESNDEPEPYVYTAGNTYFIEIRIGKKRCPALLDTGLEVTLLPKRYADLSQLQQTSRTLRAANGTVINIVGEGKTTVKLGSLKMTVNFIVSDQVDELLVGIDWLRGNKCLLSFSDLTITLQRHQFPLLKKVAASACNRIILE